VSLLRFDHNPRMIFWLIILLALFLIVPAISQVKSSSASTFQQKGTPSQAQPAGTSPLTYHGGPVENRQYAFAIFWLPSGQHFEPVGNDSRFESLISRYFTDSSGSNITQLIVQYPDNINASPTSAVIFGGGYVDTSPYPHPGTTTNPLLGQDVTNEIEKVISSGALPTGTDDAYYVFTADGINFCQDQGMTLCTFSTAQQPAGFCAYHSYLDYNSVFPYSVLSDDPTGITGGCQIPSTITTVFPNGDSTADSEISLTSQQQVNMQTDPFLSSWFDVDSTEMSAKCAGLYGTVNATDGHNIIMDSHKYIVQEEWSNAIDGCTLVPPLTTAVSVTLDPFGKSNSLSATNYFPLTYAIGKQEFVVHYISGQTVIRADPNTSLSIGPMSSNSNSGLEKWCLNVGCLGYVVALNTTTSPVLLSYYDLLEQNVYEAASDNSQPTTYAQIQYFTAPSTRGSGPSSVQTTISLAGYSQYIWVQRGTNANVSSQSYTASSKTERWTNPAAGWSINQAFQIPLVISYHQFLMNFAYTVVPSGESGLVGPTVQYVSNGTNYSALAPASVWADAGSSYGFGSNLGSSTTSERWVSVAGFGSGKVSATASVNNVYYNQFSVEVSYNNSGTTGTGSTAPAFTGHSYGSNITIPLSSTSNLLWLDANSTYSITNLLLGSNSTDRWISTASPTGTIYSASTLNFHYYHQYALNFSYTVIGGGSPITLPVVNYSSLNSTSSIHLSNSPSPVWVNAGSALNVSSVMVSSNSTERWAYSSGSTNASAPGDFTITLYHQYEIVFSIAIVGGGVPSTTPAIRAESFGQPVSIPAGNVSKIWADAGSSYSFPTNLGGNSSERWLSLAASNGIINSSLPVSVKYYNQYLISLGYSVTNGADSSGGPSATVVLFGAPESVLVNQTAGQVWADANSTASLPAQLPGSNSGERWATNSTVTGTVVSGLTLNPSYDHQFMVSLTTSPSGIPVVLSSSSGWYDSGSSLVVTLIPGRGWSFENWSGQGVGSYSGTLSSLILTVSSPMSETANFYTALTITAPSTGSVTYSFANTTGTIGTGQSKVVYVPPGQVLSMSATPFPVFYTFASWRGNITAGPNATTVAQNPLTFSVNSPSSLAVSFKINILGIVLVAVVVIVAVASVIMLRLRNRPEQADYPEEYAEGETLETMEGSEGN
jgi:hypothetical protein